MRITRPRRAKELSLDVGPIEPSWPEGSLAEHLKKLGIKLDGICVRIILRTVGKDGEVIARARARAYLVGTIWLLGDVFVDELLRDLGFHDYLVALRIAHCSNAHHSNLEQIYWPARLFGPEVNPGQKAEGFGLRLCTLSEALRVQHLLQCNASPGCGPVVIGHPLYMGIGHPLYCVDAARWKRFSEQTKKLILLDAITLNIDGEPEIVPISLESRLAQALKNLPDPTQPEPSDDPILKRFG